MDKYRKIAELLPRASATRTLFTAQVVGVQAEQGTCSVLLDDLVLEDVRLTPTLTGGGNRILLLPKTGSQALIASPGGDLSNLQLIQSDEVQGIRITCGGQDVGSLISRLLKTLAQSQVITPAGNGTFAPNVVAELNSIEMAFKQIFK